MAARADVSSPTGPQGGLTSERVLENLHVHLLAFLGVAALLTITPGPDMAVVTRITLAKGRRSAIFASVGITTGLLCWALASAVGLAALLSASATAYTGLKVVGACYLIWLGVQGWRLPCFWPACISCSV
jgi:threonine/homoserine/homoserine lactone efflux protein